jgi:two-component system, OmpR family, phosphate regulon sensor histidine kinase PhoR
MHYTGQNMLTNLLRIAQQGQTYTNMLYLLLAFPLGLVYFVLIVLGFSLGIGLLVLIIGIPLILLFLIVWWHLAVFERNITITWLNVPILPLSIASYDKRSWPEQVLARLTNAMTWKTLAYLLLKFPFGLLAFCLLVTLLPLILALGLVALILGCLVAPFLYLILLFKGHNVNGTMVSRYLLICGSGYGLLLVPLSLFNGMASLWGQFARVTLGMNEQAILLAHAKEEAEQQRAKAERADQQRRELIINVSHELRTPVASIRGHIESLIASIGEDAATSLSPATLNSYLTIVHRESVRLGTLVDDLLALARSEKSELRLHMAPAAAGEIVEEVYQTLMPLAQRERQITLICSVVPSLPLVMADRQRLLQVLLNLVRNAIAYTPDGGIVSISLAQAEPGYLALSVADTGIGITPEDQLHIFERFYRADASRSRTSGGFGLGLSIVRDFVIAMGGSIEVESSVGEGSRFCVRLHIA